jgi:hypothetical protein
MTLAQEHNLPPLNKWSENHNIGLDLFSGGAGHFKIKR